MKNNVFIFVCIFNSMLLFGQNSNIAIKEYAHGVTLQVNDQDFMINGMNWDYFPIGTNYSYSLWNQSESTIKAALDAEMSLLKKMGVNCIRQYTGVPSKWITYIYKNYGIYTMLNHSFGRYGVGLEGKWVSHTDYGHPKVQKQLLKEVISMAKTYQNTDGLLLFLLGNENNYGLFWEGAETENIPAKDQKSKALARNMYRLFNKAVVAIKAIDKQHPVAICNGDLLFIDIIAEECKDIDIFGTNVYRGATFTDAFSKVKEKLNKPIMFTEFGTDAYDVIKGAEDQKTQAYYLVNNWKDIYQNAAGLEKTGNAIGGFTFQFSDGWWKYGQTKNLSVHDTNASWANEGYTNDFKKGHNNMNEEWFGICAKGPTNSKGLYTLHPRAAYYALKAAHQLNPYQKGTTIKSIEDYFNKISLDKAVRKAQKNN